MFSGFTVRSGGFRTSKPSIKDASRVSWRCIRVAALGRFRVWGLRISIMVQVLGEWVLWMGE